MAKNEPEKPDLISRQELLQVITDHTAALGGSAPLQTAVLAWVKQLVLAMPAKAVLVDLVHCGECEYWKPSGSWGGESEDDMQPLGGCKWANCCRRATEYCSMGKRRADNGG